jgi:hypothetical protein
MPRQLLPQNLRACLPPPFACTSLFARSAIDVSEKVFSFEPDLLGGLGVLAGWCVAGVLALLGGSGGLAGWLGLGGSPEGLKRKSVLESNEEMRGRSYQVVAKQLHDEGGVLVAFFGESVELCMIVSIIRFHASSI